MFFSLFIPPRAEHKWPFLSDPDPVPSRLARTLLSKHCGDGEEGTFARCLYKGVPLPGLLPAAFQGSLWSPGSGYQIWRCQGAATGPLVCPIMQGVGVVLFAFSHSALKTEGWAC